ncbi:MAG: hypothetical protein ACTH4Y_07810 [Microbacterium gubbeenense]|uniref:hypothetical protein n=1 Tax=Microbacterium gubbeenense TaxID=159896 RepID=UPI003F97421A
MSRSLLAEARTIADNELDLAIRIVLRAGVYDVADEWITDHRRSQGLRGGGRPRTLHPAAVVAIVLVLHLQGTPPHIKQVAAVITGLSDDQRMRLGIRLDDVGSPDQWYERVRRSWDGFVDAIDPFPKVPTHQRPTVAEYEEARRVTERDPHTAVRAERLDGFANLLIDASLYEVPDEYRPPAYAVAYDATVLRVFARGIGKARKKLLGPDDKLSSEPEASFYAREREDHFDDGKLPLSKVVHGFELDLLVGMHPDPDKTHETPILTLGVAHHRPGVAINDHARAVFENVRSRGHDIAAAGADRAYLPGSKEDVLQGYLYDAGIRVVMDYRKDQLGIQAQHGGAIMVDGTWYCPAMPEGLVNLGREWAEAREQADSAVEAGESAPDIDFTERFEMRKKFALRRKQGRNPNGSTTMMCPAVGKSATVWCDHKPHEPKGRGKLPILNPPHAPGDICNNRTSMTIPRDASNGKALKYGQSYAYGTAEWAKHYGRRNVVESFNAYIKGAKGMKLDNAADYRMRGRASKYLLATIGVVAANLLKIDAFLAEREHERMPAHLRPAKTRKATLRQQLNHYRKTVERQQRLAAASVDT